jgi:hypothetical protein
VAKPVWRLEGARHHSRSAGPIYQFTSLPIYQFTSLPVYGRSCVLSIPRRGRVLALRDPG